jgi:hypothetical protein
MQYAPQCIQYFPQASPDHPSCKLMRCQPLSVVTRIVSHCASQDRTPRRIHSTSTIITITNVHTAAKHKQTVLCPSIRSRIPRNYNFCEVTHMFINFWLRSVLCFSIFESRNIRRISCLSINLGIFVFGPKAPPPQCARASSFTRFLDHTQRRTTVDTTPLDEWSARRRGLYLTTHNTYNRETSMLLVVFEPTISAGERP